MFTEEYGMESHCCDGQQSYLLCPKDPYSKICAKNPEIMQNNDTVLQM